jgi:monoterpene epsilon-lactone hydrolase
LIELGIPVPGALFAGTPEADLTKTGDMFLSNTVRVHRKLRTAGVVADLNVYEGFSHGEYLKTFDSPESQQVFAELGVFLLKYLK